MTEPHGRPPSGSPPWGRRGPPPWIRSGEGARRFRRGAGIALLVLVLLVGTLASIVTTVLSGHAPAPWVTYAVAAVVLVGLILTARWFWRNARGVGALMDAADRVAGGDYAVRVDAPGSRQLRPLVGSFNTMADHLEKNEQRRRELLGDVAHELRTPLQVIRGSVEGMLDGLYPAEPARLRGVLDETLVMARLLDDLRTLSMAEEGVLRLHRETVDPRVLVEDALRAFEPIADEARVTLTSSVEGAPLSLEADPVRVAEVLTNLLSNAIRHTPRGGRVWIHLTSVGADAVFEVSDTGPGIPVDQLPLVFDRFTRSADMGGSGLGLAIAKRLVEAHDGTIDALRRPEGGTTIRFTIPARQALRS